jgi:pSer/pThr/pTyr-binding forkhead associated (FHA) protein
MNQPQPVVEPRPPRALPDEPIQPSVTLVCLSPEKKLLLEGEGDFLIGRFDESQAIQPDIDLTPLGGYEAGVSRAHAKIQVGEEVRITDLGSVNGTRINNVKIIPHKSYILSHGDILTFGKLKMRIELFR